MKLSNIPPVSKVLTGKDWKRFGAIVLYNIGEERIRKIYLDTAKVTSERGKHVDNPK